MAFNKILVPVDGSENSEKVLDTVAGLADKLKSELVLLAVAGFGARFEDGGGAASDDRITEESKRAESYLEGRAEPLRAEGLTVTNMVEVGLPAETILVTAKEIGADLIAMSTHRESVLARGILGSVTDSVLRSAEIPVLAIHPEGSNMTAGPMWTPSEVIVPLDGSDLAAECVPVAIEIAKACDAEVAFMQAVHLPSYAISGPGADYYGTDYGVSGRREGAREYLRQFVEMAEAQGVSASSHAALGNAAARIVEETKNVPDAMIVISSHGRGGFRRMVLGSVADKLVRASHHPVLVMKHSA